MPVVDVWWNVVETVPFKSSENLGSWFGIEDEDLKDIADIMDFLSDLVV